MLSIWCKLYYVNTWIFGLLRLLAGHLVDKPIKHGGLGGMGWSLREIGKFVLYPGDVRYIFRIFCC